MGDEAISAGPGLFPIQRASSAGVAFHGAAPTKAMVFWGNSTGEVIDLQMRAGLVACGIAAGDVSIAGGTASFEAEANTYLAAGGIAANTIDGYLINYAFKTWKAAGIYGSIRRAYLAMPAAFAQGKIDWINPGTAGNNLAINTGSRVRVLPSNVGANIVDDVYEVATSGGTSSVGGRWYATVIGGAVAFVANNIEGTYTVAPTTMQLLPYGTAPGAALPTRPARFTLAMCLSALIKSTGGTGYPNGTHTVTFSDGTGTAATGTVTVVNGKMDTIELLTTGAYTVPPSSVAPNPSTAPTAVTLGANPITTQSGTKIITVAEVGHHHAVNDIVGLSGVTAFNNLTSGQLNDNHTVTAITANTWTATVGSSNNASASTAGGGAAVVMGEAASIIMEGGPGYYTVNSLVCDQVGADLVPGVWSLTFSGGGGTQATGTATVSGVAGPTYGTVTSVNLATNGQYFQAATEATIDPLALVGATDGPIFSFRAGYVSGITVADGGAGYSNGSHKLTWFGPDVASYDVLPDAVAVVSGTAVTSCPVTSPGRIRLRSSAISSEKVGGVVAMLGGVVPCTTPPTFTTSLSGTDLVVAINNAGGGLTNGTYPLALYGGTGIGGIVYCTVALNVVSSITYVSRGVYTVAPTARIAGCPTTTPTFTAALATINYAQYRGFWNELADTAVKVDAGVTPSALWLAGKDSVGLGLIMRSLNSQGSTGSWDAMPNSSPTWGIGITEDGFTVRPQQSAALSTSIASTLYNAAKPWGGLIWYNRSGLNLTQAGLNGTLLDSGTATSSALDATNNITFCGNGTKAGANEVFGMILTDSIGTAGWQAIYAGLAPLLHYRQICP